MRAMIENAFETGEPKAKVLLAEDDRMTRLIISSALVKDGYQVVEVDNGGAAYEKAVTEQPDIILLDLMMPGLDGFQVMEQMKANPETEAIPIILLTAMLAVQGEFAAMEIGANHYITKPWEPGIVETTIRVALRDAGVSSTSNVDEVVELPADVVNLKADKLNQIAMQDQLARLNSGRKKDDSIDSEGEGLKVIKTGEKLIALEQKMGGGLPLGTVTLAVGAASSGKSTLCQHFLYGALEGGYDTAVYTSEQTPHLFLAQMVSIGLDVTSHVGKEKFRIYDVPAQSESEKPEVLLNQLSQSMERLSRGAQFIVVDSITDLAGSCPEQAVIAFFSACRRMGNQGQTILVSVHSYAFGSEMLARLQALCDGYLSLGSAEVKGKSVRTLEIKKINTTEKTRDNMVSFVVEPEIGMRLIPMNRAQA